jgi:hypothetical protein
VPDDAPAVNVPVSVGLLRVNAATVEMVVPEVSAVVPSVGAV